MPKARAVGRKGQPADPCVLVLFGASGDLAKRKLFPALLNLRKDSLLPNELVVIGLATSEMTSEAFRERLGQELPQFLPDWDRGRWEWLKERIHYLPGDFRSATLYSALESLRKEQDKAAGTRGN